MSAVLRCTICATTEKVLHFYLVRGAATPDSAKPKPRRLRVVA